MLRKGPRIGTKLMLVGLVLLSLPWLAWRSLDAVDTFLLDGQRRAMRLTARGIATLLRDRVDFPPPAPGEPAPFYAWPFAEAPRLDGYAGDWQPLDGRALAFGSVRGDAPGDFRFLLATHGERLFGLLRVRDPWLVYRHPGIARLDSSDQVRLEIDGGGSPLHLLLASDGPGRIVPLATDGRWQRPFATRPAVVEAAWQPHAHGYTLEFSLPLSLAGPDPALAVTVVDVRDARERRAVRKVTTGPGNTVARRRVIYRPPALVELLAALDREDGRFWVVDRGGWVRASVGTRSSLSADPALLDRLELSPLDDALAGRAGAVELAGTGSRPVVVASEPVRRGGEVVAAVLTEQDGEALQALRHRAVVDLALATVGLLGVSVVALLLFASRLAWRIRRLGHETMGAIDERGRLLNDRIRAESRAGDELGDLSRSISLLLGRLRRHTRFLRSLPRTLRHEISNPLNTVDTALQNLAAAGGADARAVIGARRALVRLERILGGLGEAASLEEALLAEPHERVDLADLVRGYLESFARLHPGLLAPPSLPDEPVWVVGSDLRLEQLLDKLFDNAVEFTPPTGHVTVSLERRVRHAVLAVANDGPPLGEALREQLFDAPVSTRAGPAAGPHLGLGLYVARLVAEAHGGVIEARNRAPGNGVVFEVRLPLAT